MAPKREENRRRDKIGQEGAALVLVEAGRDELVDLVRDDRKGQEPAPKAATWICVKRYSRPCV